MLTFNQFIRIMKRPAVRSYLNSIRYEAITQPLYTNQEIPMAPIFRVAEHKTSDIAAAPTNLTPKELAAKRRADLREEIKQIKKRMLEGIDQANERAKKQAEADKAQLKAAKSPKAIKELEEGRKKAIRTARITAEYDAYKQMMTLIAVQGTLPLDQAHKRAQAFAEHIIKRSPPGHSDVGYIGGDNDYEPVTAYAGIGGLGGE